MVGDEAVLSVLCCNNHSILYSGAGCLACGSEATRFKLHISNYL